jgi:dTDP-4-dehydrorhamnose reductase
MTKQSVKLIIAGAKGYLGSALYAAAHNYGSVIATSSSGGTNFQCLDLNSPSDFDYEILRAGDVVLLTAAISEPNICSIQYERAWGVNVTGTCCFIESAIERGARVLFFSSDTVYGEQIDLFDEAIACNPSGEYAKMKRVVEKRFTDNASFKAIRISYVFSRQDKFSRYLTACANNREEAGLYNPFYRAIVHRCDVVEGALSLAMNWEEVPEQFINFGGPQVLSRIEFAKCLRKVYLHNLHFTVKEPTADFFKSRPRYISMTSPILARLLERPLRTLEDAALMEFASFSNTESYS